MSNVEVKKTVNLGFVELYNKLKSEGVTNIENLVNSETDLLWGVDPYDPNLDAYMKRRVGTYCVSDFWYFLKNVVRLPSVECEYVEYEIKESNYAALTALLNGVSVYANNPRYSYSTMTACCYYLWKILSSDHNYKLTILGQSGSTHKHIKDTIHMINGLLPEYLQVNKKIIDESIRPYATITDEQKANDIIGEIQYGGDLFIPDFEIIENIGLVADKLREVDWKNICVWAISSVGGYDSESKKAADRLIASSATRWHKNFFSSGLDFLETKFVYVNIPYQRLSDDPIAWLDVRKRMLNNDKELIDREVLMVR